jgi:peptide/nickel transport system permease protein
MIPTLLGVVLLVFFLFKYFGSDPAVVLAGQNASPDQIAAIREQLGLSQPTYVQLGIFLKQIVTFNWGNSWATHESIAHLFATRLPATLTVMLPILILQTVLAVPFAMLVAYKRGHWLDRTVMVGTTLMVSVSLLVYVILFQYVFAFRLGLFPVQGWSNSFWTNLFTYSMLPVIVQTVVALAPYTRLYRTFFLDEIGQDYVRTARAKGLSERTIMFKHVLRNAMVPIMTNISVSLPGVLVGSFLLEYFFSIPGLGREILLAVNRSDYPVIQAFAIYIAALTMVINLVTDILYKMVDPRVVLK